MYGNETPILSCAVLVMQVLSVKLKQEIACIMILKCSANFRDQQLWGCGIAGKSLCKWATKDGSTAQFLGRKKKAGNDVGKMIGVCKNSRERVSGGGGSSPVWYAKF